MRKQKVLKNTFLSIFSYLILSVFKLYIRKLFLLNFSLELLGYEGLFTSIFLVLSIAEMGSESLFSYMLYKSVAENDVYEQSVVMSIYRMIYSCVGFIVIVFGVIVFFILPYIISDQSYSWNYIRYIYVLQLLSVLIQYFLAYKRSLIYAHQSDYIVTKYTFIYEFFGNIFRVFIILFIKNYTIYVLIPLFVNLFTNISISKYCDSFYKINNNIIITLNDLKKRNIFHQIGSLLISKVSTVLYTASDNIIISMFFGVKTMGLFANYIQFTTAGKTLLSFFTGALGHSVGDFIYDRTANNRNETFFVIDSFGFIIGAFSFIFGFGIFKYIIMYLYGDIYIMDYYVPLFLSLDFYIRCRGISYGAFRYSVGYYHETKHIDFLAAISNIVLSIILGEMYGIGGVLFATVIGNILIQFGRAKITYKYVISTDLFIEFIKEICYLMIIVFTAFVVYKIQYFYSDLIIVMILLLFLFIFVNILLFVFDYRYKLLLNNFSDVILILKKRL